MPTTSLARRVLAVYTRQAPAFQARSPREVTSWATAIDRHLKRRAERAALRALTGSLGESTAHVDTPAEGTDPARRRRLSLGTVTSLGLVVAWAGVLAFTLLASSARILDVVNVGLSTLVLLVEVLMWRFRLGGPVKQLHVSRPGSAREVSGDDNRAGDEREGTETRGD